jgi:hypothetical protein
MIRLPASVPYLAVLGVAAGLLLGSGCASRPDWIESTLVTVDVTGRWHGTFTGSGGSHSMYVDLALAQSGARVVGTIRAYGAFTFGARSLDGTLEGSVAGDVLRFERTGTPLWGEATVDGDEMTGRFVGVAQMPEGRLVLRRVDRTAAPPMQRP